MTKAEQSHLNAVANVGCIVCRIHLNVFSPCHIHHIRHGMGMGQRNNNYNVIGLCPPHHQTGGHGVAFHAGKEAFQENFGTELELQERLNEFLAVVGAMNKPKCPQCGSVLKSDDKSGHPYCLNGCVVEKRQ